MQIQYQGRTLLCFVVQCANRISVRLARYDKALRKLHVYTSW